MSLVIWSIAICSPTVDIPVRVLVVAMVAKIPSMIMIKINSIKEKPGKDLLAIIFFILSMVKKDLRPEEYDFK